MELKSRPNILISNLTIIIQLDITHRFVNKRLKGNRHSDRYKNEPK